jgi:hypothetical protein
VTRLSARRRWPSCPARAASQSAIEGTGRFLDEVREGLPRRNVKGVRVGVVPAGAAEAALSAARKCASSQAARCPPCGRPTADLSTSGDSNVDHIHPGGPRSALTQSGHTAEEEAAFLAAFQSRMADMLACFPSPVIEDAASGIVRGSACNEHWRPRCTGSRARQSGSTPSSAPVGCMSASSRTGTSSRPASGITAREIRVRAKGDALYPHFQERVSPGTGLGAAPATRGSTARISSSCSAGSTTQSIGCPTSGVAQPAMREAALHVRGVNKRRQL